MKFAKSSYFCWVLVLLILRPQEPNAKSVGIASSSTAKLTYIYQRSMDTIYNRVKKLFDILFKPRMQQLIGAAAEANDLDTLEMAAIKYSSMQSKLYCVTVNARDMNVVFLDVADNYLKQGLTIPTPQQLLPICNACWGELVNAAGDLTDLRRVEEKYKEIFRKM